MWEKNKSAEISAGQLVLQIPILIGATDTDQNFSKIPYSIVMTHACDLSSHYIDVKKKQKLSVDNESTCTEIIRTRGELTQVLFVPAFIEEEFASGKHLNPFKIEVGGYSLKEMEKFRTQIDMRYHYLKSTTGDSIPNLYIDFKHYFTLPIAMVNAFYENSIIPKYILKHIFFTQLSDRFSHYMQRVAIPD